MKKLSAPISLAFTVAIVTSATMYIQPAISKTPAGVSVNGVVIPQARIDVEVDEQIERGAPPEERKLLEKQAKSRLIELEMMNQEAKKRGLEKHPDVIQRIEVARQVALAQAVSRDYAKNNKITDADLKKEYETYKTEIKPSKSFDEAKEDLRNRIQQRRINEFVENLRSKTKIIGSD